LALQRNIQLNYICGAHLLTVKIYSLNNDEAWSGLGGFDGGTEAKIVLAYLVL